MTAIDHESFLRAQRMGKLSRQAVTNTTNKKGLKRRIRSRSLRPTKRPGKSTIPWLCEKPTSKKYLSRHVPGGQGLRRFE